MTYAIITDAGFETISYELATQFFSASDIQYWWTSVAGLDEFEAIELEKQIIQSKADDWQIVQEFLSTFDWLPEKIDVVTARAVFTPAYQWVKVIELGDKQTGEWMSDTYEREAIALGIKLRRHLGDDELLILNDNKNAVWSRTSNPQSKIQNLKLFGQLFSRKLNQTNATKVETKYSTC